MKDNLLWIFLGGGLGSLSRFGLFSLFGRYYFGEFPWGTLSVNLLGAFFIGVIIELLALKFNATLPLKQLLVTGFLGGFTTFSTFSLESTLMWEKGNYGTLACYVIASVLGTILLVRGGIYLVRSLV